jgi:hypothetical protein
VTSSHAPWPPLRDEDVRQRLSFARQRADDLLALDHPLQQLTQEFFFHLVGAIEMTAQRVNAAKGLGLDAEAVTVWKVQRELGASDPVSVALGRLYATPRRNPMPADPYGDEGTIYRIYNYRGQVTHRRLNPLVFKVGDSPEVVTHFALDPRAFSSAPSNRTAREDIEHMYAYVRDGCEAVLALL